jgi:hypothetical protein
MRMEQFGLIVSNSTHKIIQIEKFILEKGFKVRIIPVPKEITASCGLSIKFEISVLNNIKLILEESFSDFSIYMVEKSGLKKNITQI